MAESDLDKLRRLRDVGASVASRAAELKEEADKLRADVDALTARLDAVEQGGVVVASNLIEATEKVAGEQEKQDDRLTTLENGN